MLFIAVFLAVFLIIIILLFVGSLTEGIISEMKNDYPILNKYRLEISISIPILLLIITAIITLIIK